MNGLYEPGPGSQVHDFNGGLGPSGLFWTVQLPDDVLEVAEDGRRAVVRVKDLPLVDSFQAFGPNSVPATVNLEVTWEGKGEPQERGSGKSVPATDSAAFSGRFREANATASFSGSELGFSFSSRPGVNTDEGFARMGTERNGSFLQ